MLLNLVYGKPFYGSVFNIPEIKFDANGVICDGILYSAFMIFLYRFPVFRSSKGNSPQIIANKTTPQTPYIGLTTYITFKRNHLWC